MTFRLSQYFFLGLFLFSFFVSVFSPLPANAVIVPCGRTGADATAEEKKPCTICHLVVGGNRIIEWGLKVMTFVGLAVIVAMAIFYIVSTGNEGMMKTAKGGITAALAGFAIMLAAWLIVNTTLRILTATIPGLVVSSGGFSFTCDTTSLASSATGGGPGGGATCEDPNAMKQRLNNGGTVCGGTCSIPAGFKAKILSDYGTIISNYGGGLDVITALIYQESKGDPNAHSADGGCGLMQITNSAWVSSCPASILVPDENIKQGIALYNQKLQSVQGKSYGGGITQKQMAFAAYNCCNNGEDPNAPSASCKTTDGWPPLPKWACPIEPGNGTSNMCAVKAYACNVGACT
jgi:Transglycosylase SLT domain